MKQTANYQLNQWEQADRILMADFNADNLKVDGALAGLQTALSAETAALAARIDALTAALEAKSPFVKLKEVYVPENKRNVTMDLSDIDWSEWQAVYLDCDCPLSESASLRLNTSNGPSFASFGIKTVKSPEQRITFPVGRLPGRLAAGSVTYGEIKALVWGDGVLYAGTTLTLWGLK